MTTAHHFDELLGGQKTNSTFALARHGFARTQLALPLQARARRI